MGKKFPEYKGFDLSQINKEVLEIWENNNCFEKSVRQKNGKGEFIFFEGPPSANGMPGIHHVLARTIKDAICRYRTQCGYEVKRKAGWDTHGLPVELGVEKSLGITKEDIGKKISVEDYNKACRSDVMKFTDKWEELTKKMGYWVRLDNAYITYDNRYIETLWWLLKQLYNQGLLYKGYTIQPYSPAAGTGLSSHELNLPGCYRDTKDNTCTAQFKVIDNGNKIVADIKGKASDKFKENIYILAWTTTPWTLPSNTALCVGPKIEYVAVETFNPYNGLPMTCILAKQRLSAYFNPKGEDTAFEDYKAGDKIIPYKVIAEYTGEDLLEMKYEQLFPWVDPVSMEDDGKSLTNRKDDAFRVIPGAYVTTEDGTGIVHIAPTFGADDAKVAKAAGVPSLFLINKKDETRPMVDFTGKYWTLDELRDDFVKDYVKEEYKKFAGKWVKNAYDPQYTVNGKYDEEAASKAENLDIFLCMDMKQSNKVFKIEKHVHNYPYCWRTDKPILYYPLDSWFIRTTSVKDRMIELNKTINWRPEATGTGRFGNWLENLVDWNLSRSRFWGTPLPIWISEDKKEQKCIGSVAELKAEIDKAVKAGFMTNNPLSSYVEGDNSKENYESFDLHKPYVDNIVLVSDSGKKMLREPDLIDVWFDSGAMPYAQSHYPFENKESFDSRKIFPADFIAEGVDQTRGWFFTLHAIATMISDSVAFKNIISNGLVLDKNGNKMSKRLGNAVDPFKVIEEYGSDPLRWYMMTNAQPWDNLKFDINGIDEVKRKFFGTLYNTYSFFALYANIDGFTYKEAEFPMSERPEIDRWIISLLNSLVKETQKCYESYDITRAGRAIQDFVTDNLSNWYVRLNRKRFWGGNYNTDKISAYQTLYTCLETISRIAAPIAPFYMDKLFCDLNSATGKSSEISVHLADFPQYDESLIDSNLEERMDIAQKISSMVLGLLRKVSIKVRQPLAKIMIPLPDKDFKAKFDAVKPLVLSEINVKEVEYIEDSSTLLKKKVKPNFKALGPRYGKLMKELGASIAAMSQADIASFEANKSFSMKVAGQDVELTEQDLEVISEDIPGWQVANEGQLTVALDVTVTDELRHEGVARELVNRIQNIRKDSGFDVTDKIAVKIEDVESVKEAIKTHGKYISQQTLASSIELTNTFGDNVKDIDIDDISIKMEIIKI